MTYSQGSHLQSKLFFARIDPYLIVYLSIWNECEFSFALNIHETPTRTENDRKKMMWWEKFKNHLLQKFKMFSVHFFNILWFHQKPSCKTTGLNPLCKKKSSIIVTFIFYIYSNDANQFLALIPIHVFVMEKNTSDLRVNKFGR